MTRASSPRLDAQADQLAAAALCFLPCFFFLALWAFLPSLAVALGDEAAGAALGAAAGAAAGALAGAGV